MSISLTCGPSGSVITGETEEELVAKVQAHARAHENTELSRDRILAEIRRRDAERLIDAAAWDAMDATATLQKLCDTSDMVIVHRMFRRECAMLPKLVAGVASGDVARARTVAGHAREVLDMLHHHHMGEDELLWPRLSARTRFHADLLARMDSQHQGLAVLLEQAATALAEWQDAPTVHMSTPLTVILNQLSTGLNEHFDEEEAAILPIVERVITAVEYREVGLRGLVSIPLTRRLIVLGYILEGATSQERNVFLAAIPRPVRIAYRLLGERQHRHETTRLRGPLQPGREHGPGSTAGDSRPVLPAKPTMTVGQFEGEI
ncbi:MAG: hemerythrin domain-containing protein [Mycobacterium sp.]|uniref:hemerythrin domain-containing protein n=1 Tax=Mycobacterium sp. TaxID=1785 RepID=UPI003C78143C